jgi:septal ring factor EnvC (AmiA/AmiB activator)
MALEATLFTIYLQARDPMEWIDGRITKRSVDAGAPETRNAITNLSYIGADKLELTCAREKILDLMYEIEALRREHSGSFIERLKAELSASYATNQGFRQQWEDERERLNAALEHEREENETLDAALEHEREENKKLGAGLEHEREENEKLNAVLKFALLENEDLTELTRSLKEQANGLRAILGTIADRLTRGPGPLRLPKIIDGDDGVGVTDDLAA